MYKYTFIFISCSALITRAQVLLPTPETAFESSHHFNPSVVKQKGVKKITFEILDKKDFEVAEDKSLVETYEFNADGLLSRYYLTNISKIIEKQVTKTIKTRKKHHRTIVETSSEYIYDTVSTCYFYSGKNMILKRYHDGANYYESRYYRYDSEGNLTKELRFKETNNSPFGSVFILGNQLLMSEDSFQYTKYASGQIKCVLLNNENRPYKEKIINSDSLGRKVNINESYTAAAWIRQELKFEYSGGKLVAAQFEGNANNTILLKNTYEYDERNELYTEKQYRNDVLIKEISYVSDKAQGLLNSIITRDPINKTIRIIKLKYDFGMIGKTDD